MKANFQHLGFEQVHDSFLCYWVRSDFFGFHWHYHPELEITYVHRGKGIRLVGNNVDNFQAGDFVFLGSNLPHTWISDDDFKQSDEQMEVIVLQFPPTLFSPAWLSLPEMQYLKKLMQNAHRGIAFSPSIRYKAIQILQEMTISEGFTRFHQLMDLLNLLGSEQNPQYLASLAYTPSLDNSTEQRLLEVCRFIHDHFTEPISLETVANMANMNSTAFCRFFKKMTGQTLTEYITDLRIGKACNLLLDQKQYSIAAIAHQSGFNSQTLFNRRFRRKKGMTPRAFRAQLS